MVRERNSESLVTFAATSSGAKRHGTFFKALAVLVDGQTRLGGGARGGGEVRHDAWRVLDLLEK